MWQNKGKSKVCAGKALALGEKKKIETSCYWPVVRDPHKNFFAVWKKKGWSFSSLGAAQGAREENNVASCPPTLSLLLFITNRPPQPTVEMGATYVYPLLSNSCERMDG